MKQWIKDNWNTFAFVLGFAYDIFSLHGKIGNISFAMLIAYLCLFQISLIARLSSHPKTQVIGAWTSHFCLGSLFSALTILYFKSSHLAYALLFSFLFGLGLFLNEFKWSKKRKIEIVLILQPLITAAMLAFLLPHAAGQPSIEWTKYAWLGGLATSTATWLLIRNHISSTIKNFIIAHLLWLLFGLFIFSGKFPALPLHTQEFLIAESHSQPFGGLCPKQKLFNKIGISTPKVSSQPYDEVFFYTAIYSPRGMNANLKQTWSFWNGKDWETKKTVLHHINGGREKGFRLWGGFIQPKAGLWKIEINVPGFAPLSLQKFEITKNNIPVELCKLP